MIDKENFPDSPVGNEPVWVANYMGKIDYDEVEFSKSLISDLDEDEEEYYYDEFGIKRKRKVMLGRELQDINVEEISL